MNAGSSGTLNADINTGLPQGSYCDVISGNYVNGKCTGTTVHVGANGHAHFNIAAISTDPVVAIHIGKRRLISIQTRICPLHFYLFIHNLIDKINTILSLLLFSNKILLKY